MLIHTDARVYGPEDDTFLLLETLQNEPLSGSGLEIGVGTGFIALHICKYFDIIIGVDINPHAVELAAKNARENNIGNVSFFVSNLFSAIRGTFDVIIFNPPYVPADEVITSIEDMSYHGGEDGRQVINQFLPEFPFYLNPGGTVYLLQSSLSNTDKTCETLRNMKFTHEILARKRLFFEELVVFKIRRNPND